MKLDGMAGTGTGRLGQQIYAVSKGQQIVRAVPASVSNPNTVLQTNQRVRFKLASQLAAAMEAVIAIQPKALSTPRNRFVKKNMPLIYADGSEAIIAYDNIQLTDSALALPSIVMERNGNVLSVGLNSKPSMDIKRIVYCVFEKTVDNELALLGSTVQTEAGSEGIYAAELPATPGDLVVYAYGIRDNNNAATVRYQNYQVETGEDIARLIANRTLKATDYSMTQTVGDTLYSGETDNLVPGENQVEINLSVLGPGEIHCNTPSLQIVNGRIVADFGSDVELEVDWAEGWNLDGWYYVGALHPFATSKVITIRADLNHNILVKIPVQGLE